MAYQASVAYPAASSGPWSGAHAADSAYYQQYYSSYGYGGNYDMSAYYQQQQAPQYAVAVPGQSSYHAEQRAPEVSIAAGAPPPAPPSGAPPSVSVGAPPPPPDASLTRTESVPPPPPTEPPPPPGTQENGQTQPSELPVDAAAGHGAEAATASTGYDAAAYAQWYSQNYGAYYSYPGYDQQSYAYWQQQQPQQHGAYGYGSHAYGQQQQQPSVPPPAPPSSEPPGNVREKQVQLSGSSSQGLYDTYNMQAPPSGLYSQQPALKANQGRPRTGATGPNSVPIGPRPPPGDPPASASSPAAHAHGKQQPAIIIRSQLPLAKRTSTLASPAYISVGAASTPAPAGSTPNGSNVAVAAAVAAGAASAVAAASAAKSTPPSSLQGSTQWPPSFTAWVTRCFNTARLRNIPDTRLSEKLMAYLDQVKAEGRLWTTDWDTLPIMLPDSPTSQNGAGFTAANQVLSLGESQNRKRNRWGAVPEVHDGHGNQHGHDHHRVQHQAQNGYRKRVYDVDSDEDDYTGERESTRGGSTPILSPHKVGGMQSVSNRKRKKLLQLEHQQHQPGRRGGHGVVSVEDMRRRARAGRFGDGRAAGICDDSSGMDMSDEEEVAARHGGVVVGTCQALEKSYFRLTSQPEPSSVRPEAVLDRALERLVAMIARGDATYFYSLDQFKGMRQDCTVQHLRNALAVRVYEAHARSSLEYSDTAEFNQCQARLGHLYGEGQPGCMAEFTAYRVLYETVHCATAGLRGGSMAKSLLHTMRNIQRDLMGSPEIRHALQVREAVMTYNYAAFFRLYASAPHLGRAIMDVVAEPMRWAGLNAFVKACDLPLPVAEMAQLLGFAPRHEAAEPGGCDAQAKPLPGCKLAHLAGDAAAAATAEQGLADCADWLRGHSAVVTDKGGELLLDTKASRGKLFVPEVTAKVAHGDENLSLHDFLSQAQRGMAD